MSNKGTHARFLGQKLITNDKGWFANEAAIINAYPIGQDGWYVVNGDTDTIWIWDGDTSAWVDSGIKPTELREADGASHIKPKDSKKVKVENIDGALNLNQTTPQEVVGGAPIFRSSWLWLVGHIGRQIPVEVEDGGDYKVLQYNFGETILYRRYYKEYSLETDQFYEDSELRRLVATRALSF